MPKFMITYIGGDHPSDPEEGKIHFEKYKLWLKELGNKVVSPANPLNNTHTILPNGSTSKKSSSNMSGFTVIEAESIEKAIELTKNCPFLELGGTLEVSEMVEMNM